MVDVPQLVAGSVVMAFEEVCPERIDLIHKNYRKLCNLLIDVEEWGQVVIINMLTRYARTQFLNPNINVSSAQWISRRGNCGNVGVNQKYLSIRLCSLRFGNNFGIQQSNLFIWTCTVAAVWTSRCVRSEWIQFDPEWSHKQNYIVYIYLLFLIYIKIQTFCKGLSKLPDLRNVFTHCVLICMGIGFWDIAVQHKHVGDFFFSATVQLLFSWINFLLPVQPLLLCRGTNWS